MSAIDSRQRRWRHPNVTCVFRPHITLEEQDTDNTGGKNDVTSNDVSPTVEGYRDDSSDSVPLFPHLTLGDQGTERPMIMTHDHDPWFIRDPVLMLILPLYRYSHEGLGNPWELFIMTTWSLVSNYWYARGRKVWAIKCAALTVGPAPSWRHSRTQLVIRLAFSMAGLLIIYQVIMFKP